MAKHKYAEVIKAWADGAQIQYYCIDNDTWIDCNGQINWYSAADKRIKPERVYPMSKMTETELYEIASSRRSIADAAIRHAIDAGQVVIPDTKYADQIPFAGSPKIFIDFKAPEMNRAYAQGRRDGNADRAVRDMAIAEAVRLAASEMANFYSSISANYINNKLNLSAIIARVK